MRKLNVYNQVSLDGYIMDSNGDMSWAQRNDPEWNEYVMNNAQGRGGVLVFGRVTYDLMSSFWPTPLAMETMPEVAKGMNAMSKVVFSRTLDEVRWANTRIARRGLVEEIRGLKEEPGKDLLIMGSGSIVSQLTEAGLIDEFQIVLVPVVLGGGKTMFEGVKRRPVLERTEVRTFSNGNIVLTYVPTRA